MSKSAPPPLEEASRLAELRGLKLLDTPPEKRFDRITVLARQVFQTPTAVISLVDKDRQWFKSRSGIEACETPRAHAFCAHALNQTENLVVLDAALDPRFSTNPLVTGPPFIRFYAGAPLLVASGAVLGTLCIIDIKPRTEFRREEQRMLREMADLVVAQIEESYPPKEG